MKNEFDRWFILNFGRRPNTIATGLLRDKALKTQAMADEAQALLRQCASWDNEYDAALRAWNSKCGVK